MFCACRQEQYKKLQQYMFLWKQMYVLYVILHVAGFLYISSWNESLHPEYS